MVSLDITFWFVYSEEGKGKRTGRQGGKEGKREVKEKRIGKGGEAKC